MSIVGYIIGLGDRHPDNFMAQRLSRKVVHIDFGDCFEVAQKRATLPERIPFRLTKMMVKAFRP
jgi:FKBP12-rapamycin complex-associated protein